MRQSSALAVGWVKVVLSSVVALVCFLAGLYWYSAWMLARNVDFLFDHVLGKGNLEVAYRNSDPRFQITYSEDRFKAFAAGQPSVFQRDRVRALEVVWQKRNNELLVVLKTRVDANGQASAVDYYCRPAGLNEWRLVGIVPGLEAAIPGVLTTGAR